MSVFVEERWARQAESSAADVWTDGVRCEMRAWLGEVVGGSGRCETGAALALGIFTRECAGAGGERTAIGGR